MVGSGAGIQGHVVSARQFSNPDPRSGICTYSACRILLCSAQMECWKRNPFEGSFDRVDLRRCSSFLQEKKHFREEHRPRFQASCTCMPTAFRRYDWCTKVCWLSHGRLLPKSFPALDEVRKVGSHVSVLGPRREGREGRVIGDACTTTIVEKNLQTAGHHDPCFHRRQRRQMMNLTFAFLPENSSLVVFLLASRPSKSGASITR